MPPVRTQINCPNCRRPVQVTLEQLLDAGQDPAAKQRFLSGRFNQIQCQSCGFQGQATSPILYHDPDKELLLTYVPMELALPQAEQERLIGRLVNEAINKLPQEKRKGYLLSPKPAFTLQGMMERVLEADGVTKEMLDAQRAKVQFLQELLKTPDEKVAELIKAHDADVDATLMQLLAASAEATAAEGNRAGAEKMLALQAGLLANSSFGAKVQARQKKVEAVASELQALGRKLTPDKLLELVMKSDDEDRLAALVTFARAGMDYAFFEALTRRIDKAKDPEKERLGHIRERLLALTQEIDKAAQAEMNAITRLLRELLEAPDLPKAIQDHLPEFDDTFFTVLNANIEAAQRANRRDVVDRLNRINQAVMQTLQESAPPELKFINDLLEMESDEVALAALKDRAPEVTPGLVDALNYVTDSLRQQGQPAMADRLEKLRAAAVGVMMQANWRQ